MLLSWSIRHFTSQCPEKQTPIPCPFLGSGQSVANPQIKRLCCFCYVLSWSITLLYIKRSCWVSWTYWWSDALTPPYSRLSLSCSVSGMLDRVYWCGFQIFLAILIALKSKDICFLPCVIGYPITKWSWMCCQFYLFSCTSSVKELGSYQNSYDHFVLSWKARLLWTEISWWIVIFWNVF